MAYGYSADVKGNHAKAVSIFLPVSSKHCIEICNFIRGKPVERAKRMLEEVMKLKTAVPFKRFTESVGHRRGSICSGRFPVKAAKEILKTIKSAEANAQFKGLSTSELVLKHISSQRAAITPHYGRTRGQKHHRTTIEVIVAEMPREKKEGKKEMPSKGKAKAEKPAGEKK